jgi:hypothetical protein
VASGPGWRDAIMVGKYERMEEGRIRKRLWPEGQVVISQK